MISGDFLDVVLNFSTVDHINSRSAQRNEAGIHFELYRLLVNAGLHVVPECKYTTSNGQVCYFDLTLWRDGEIYLIIELKRSTKAQYSWDKTQQAKKYMSFGIPVLLVNRTHDLEKVVEYCISL